jgi:FAD/FMN-containing dehydrogenase
MSVPSVLDTLPSALAGDVALPGDESWDGARQAWNLAVDQHPAAVVHAEDADDVARVVDYARKRGMRVAAQATGHGAGAIGALDETILLKTARLDGIEVDAGARRARVEAGVLAGEVAVRAGDAGLAALLGSSSDVGVTGLTLGGGVGWLARRYGLASNSVIAIELVTADGRLQRVDDDNEPDLFFALRGGGGSFGIVTALDIELKPVSEVYAGMVAWPVDMAGEIAHAYREWHASAPDEISAQLRFLNLPPLPQLPEPLRGRPLIDVLGAYVGDPASGAELMRPLREIAGAVWDTWDVLPAAELRELAMDPQEPVPGVGDSAMLAEFTPDAADALVQVAGAGSGSPLTAVQVRQLGGALGREPEGAGALGKIDADHIVFGVGAVFDEGTRAAVKGHLDLIQAELAPFATDGRALNFSDRPGDASAAFSPDVWRRLTEVKARYDPGNLFQAGHQVPPAG